MSNPLPATTFADRHLGPRPNDATAMLETLGFDTMDAMMDAVVPDSIRLRRALDLPSALSESEALDALRTLAGRNERYRSYIGMGYANCQTPPVILRNVLESPGWYTAYTPYQPEIAQGRLEALLNFQTMIADLTGLPVANASLLDEGTAAAEAMSLTLSVAPKTAAPVYLVDIQCHPQTIAVLRTRCEARGVTVRISDPSDFVLEEGTIGMLLQYPGTEGGITDHRELVGRARAAKVVVTVATDLLALALLVPPGEWGADVVVGNSQRFGVPLGYGGPHAAFFATREEYKRNLPGRLIGVSQDSNGRPALRMALQTREQHIRRERATSNVCTAQVLLAVIAGMYAVYHGPEGIQAIARRVHDRTRALAEALRGMGYALVHEHFFDTITVDTDPGTATRIRGAARERAINLRILSDTRLGVTLDETVTERDFADLVAIFSLDGDAAGNEGGATSPIPDSLKRTSPYLTHPVFRLYRSETEMLRYLHRLENRDLSLTSAMIPLGSCTMKLNATSEMIPVTWPEFGDIHPFAPRDQAAGYQVLFEDLERWLAEITGFKAISLQPNAGSQGEFAGLLAIRAYHRARGDAKRTVCLIPQSAHGTNPASAIMAGLKVVVVKTDDDGNIDIADLRARASEHQESLAALMVTYPSTHGVFEAGIREICEIVHEHGGQVYMDGANLNAQVGLCRPGDMGADVCHLNLHKTFCIPHGGGGPGMGPIGVAEHLVPFLPDHPVVALGHAKSSGTISAAPWGSPSILPISWAYIRMMGPEGLTRATQTAILNANYIARRLRHEFPVLYSGPGGFIGHECILDIRPFKTTAEVDVEDVAKRLIDYGFHPPTVSFPVAGTLMVEPTESESREELDRFVEAMLAIREEIREIEEGHQPRGNNVLTNAPHTQYAITQDEWDRPYSRQRAVFPTHATREYKSWPTVGRIDGAYGDRNLVCVCPPIEAYDD